MLKFKVKVVYIGEFEREVEAEDSDAAVAKARQMFDEGQRALPELEVRTHLYVEETK